MEKKTASAEASTRPAKRRRCGGIECRLGLLIGVAGLIGGRLSQLWIAFDVFAQFTLQFAVITLAFAIGFFLPRGRTTAAFLLILAGLAAIGAWPHVVSREPQVRSTLREGERALTVASFNTRYDNQNVAAVRAEIERLDADIVTLVELGPNKRAMLEELKPRYPYRADCFAIDFCNLAILSKMPIVEQSGKVEWEGPPIIVAKLGPEADGLTVVGVHTIRFPHWRSQFQQAQALTRMIETIPGRKLVMGDFNATPFSRIAKTVSSETGLVRLTWLPSWPSRLELPQVAIDHIFASPGIRVLEDERIGEAAGSDHYPIFMKLAVPAP
ncbi:MAG: endonuclease/exonuclease/phosphatase family protein [Rhizobiales bacterium]|nr:endonuclease/exonuclease/phosphatase family protein [Hyphomicrobiales bacterium]MBI3671983.1 endonuclease/exonuclease/phosphatase family protein [Hyphomicrobiales bacterium]